MNAEVFRNMDRHGRNYWWYRGKQAFVQEFCRRLGVRPGGRVLDLGCGTGTLFEFLEGWGDVTGLELSADALILAKAHSDVPLVRASIDAIPFRKHSYKFIAVFDCLEHLIDDRKAMTQVLDLLTPGGWVAVSVPAFRFLTSWRDYQLRHMRRYSANQLQVLLERSGFKVHLMTYAYLCLFFPLLLKALKDRLFPFPSRFKSDIDMLREPLNSMVSRWLAVEAWFAARTGLPFGTSLFAFARPEAAPHIEI
jgi:SAM-dependent methyltransferase